MDESLESPQCLETDFSRPTETVLNVRPLERMAIEPATTRISLRKALNARGFVCQREDFHFVCVGTMQPYPKRVAFFIPHQLRSLDQIRIHFHGWIIRATQERVGRKGWRNIDVFAEDLNNLRYDRIFQDENNSILIVPESTGHNDTHTDFFGVIGNFHRFVNEVDQIAVKARWVGEVLPSILVSGHSGAYKPISLITLESLQPWSGNSALARIQRIKLLDATYGTPFSTRLKWIYRWLKAGTDRFLEINYVPGSRTETGANDLLRLATYSGMADRISVKTYVRRESTVTDFYDLLPPVYQGRHFRLLMDRF